MKSARMRKETLVRLVEKYHLPIPSPEKMLVGHLRHQFEIHFPTYLEEWFKCRVRETLLPKFPGMLMPARNQCRIPGSKLEFDFSWNSLKLAVEIQGGLKNAKSGHRSEAGIKRDMRKVNLAQINGWILLQLTSENITCTHEWSAYTLPLLVSAIRNRNV